MDTMAPLRPLLQRALRVSLPAGPRAPSEARGHVRGAIRAWDVPVDPDVAVLLTSELVTNAIAHETGGTILLAVWCGYGQLHVDVHDTARSVPVPIEARAADAEAGRGLRLVASLSTTWGYYPTATGKAVYFTLAFRAAPGAGDPSCPQGDSYVW